MRVILGADHGGFAIKEKVMTFLEEIGHEVEDVGAYQQNGDDDYVDYAVKAIKEMMVKEPLSNLGQDRVILFCRNGMGMMITANKHKGIRCGLGFGPEAVRKGRMDDDINALAIPADYCTDEGVKDMVKIFLETEFSNTDRYKKRLEKLEKIEEKW